MFDRPKFGNPRTDAERRKRHIRLHGTKALPKRGTGRGFVADALKERGAK